MTVRDVIIGVMEHLGYEVTPENIEKCKKRLLNYIHDFSGSIVNKHPQVETVECVLEFGKVIPYSVSNHILKIIKIEQIDETRGILTYNYLPGYRYNLDDPVGIPEEFKGELIAIVSGAEKSASTLSGTPMKISLIKSVADEVPDEQMKIGIVYRLGDDYKTLCPCGCGVIAIIPGADFNSDEITVLRYVRPKKFHRQFRIIKKVVLWG